MARTQGLDLLERINDGRTQVAPSEFLKQTREDVSAAIEELVEILLGMATSLPREEIRELSLIELRSLSRIVKAMSDSDLRLYSYISAFVTTSHSEQLWFSQGTALTSFRERLVKMPDGAEIRITAPSDQARLWATLCNYRVQDKQRLEASMNALLTIRPVVGKGADGLANEMKGISRSLQTDILDPWRELVRVTEERNLADGWSHSGDDSDEGMMRELKSMMDNHRPETAVLNCLRNHSDRPRLASGRQQSSHSRDARSLLSPREQISIMWSGESFLSRNSG